MLRRMGTSSLNWSKDDIYNTERVPYINKDFDEDCEYHVNISENNGKKNKEIENNKKGGNKINELINYFDGPVLSEDEEEEVELRNYTSGKVYNEQLSDEEGYGENEDEKKSTEIFSNVSMKDENCNKKTLDKVLNYFNESSFDEKEYEENGVVRRPSELVEEKENVNVNTCCGQDIPNSQQEIEQNTEDVKIPKRICKFQPTKYKGFKLKETMLIEKNTANANDESFVTFKQEPAEQKKEKSDEEEKPEITLDGINHNSSESDFSFRIDKKQDNKCDTEVEVGEKCKSDYKKKFKDRLTLNCKIKVGKLHLYPQVGTTWNSYDKVLSRFCENSPKEIEVSIPKGGSFQISGFKVMNNKKKNNVANVTKTCIDGKKITFICK